MKFCRWTLLEAGGGFIYEELKDIFEENKQGFYGKSLTFVAFKEHMANKTTLSVSQNHREVSC